MKPTPNQSARKRPVNLSLDEKLVVSAKSLTDNLSALVEKLLADFVISAQKERLLKTKAAERSASSWNDFNSERGSIADEYSSL